jgi:hypothetical protein
VRPDIEQPPDCPCDFANFHDCHTHSARHTPRDGGHVGATAGVGRSLPASPLGVGRTEGRTGKMRQSGKAQHSAAGRVCQQGPTTYALLCGLRAQGSHGALLD